jgi:hypothetical protein
MRDIFACNNCNSIYEITRLQQRPAAPPRCQVCFASLPTSELGDWLAYERAEQEWSVANGSAAELVNSASHHPVRRSLGWRKEKLGWRKEK